MSELIGPQYLNEQHAMHECPKCGKHSLVQITNTKFECIWCDFHRNLNTSTKKNKSKPFLSNIATLGLTGLGLIVLSSFFSTLLSSESNPTRVKPNTSSSSNVEAIPERTFKIPTFEETKRRAILSGDYPQEACGYDINQVEKGVNIVELYPIFVGYSPAILETIKTEYCLDAFRNNQNGLIQVASFRNRDKANEFRAFMETTFGYAQVGAVRQVTVQ